MSAEQDLPAGCARAAMFVFLACFLLVAISAAIYLAVWLIASAERIN